MIGSRTMKMTIVMAVLCMAGIVGMLVAEGAWNGAFFLLFILPLLVGAVCWWRRRSSR